MEIKMKWIKKQRLEFIENRLYWQQELSRSDLIKYFDISVAQATKDLKEYNEVIAKGNMKYDHSLKTYLPSDTFKPMITNISSEKYLRQLQIDKMLGEDIFLFGDFTQYSNVETLRRPIDHEILRAIVTSINKVKAIEIEYQSMTKTKKHWRYISPKSLAYNGFRWHCRAYCHDDNRFKDFVLGRILKIRNSKECNVNFADDFEWHNNVIFKIGIKDNLTTAQKKCIEHDYGMKEGIIEVKVKAAFVNYFKSNCNFDSEYTYITLLNEKEIDDKVIFLKEITSSRLEEK